MQITLRLTVGQYMPRYGQIILVLMTLFTFQHVVADEPEPRAARSVHLGH
jgi:hypothetical protein